MQLENVKQFILGKWKSVGKPDLILEFQSGNRVIVNSKSHTEIYTISNSGVPNNRLLLNCPAIGFWTAFIEEINIREMKIINLDHPLSEPIQINPINFEILSAHTILNFVRE